MIKVKITKRRYIEDGIRYFECYCNEHRIAVHKVKEDKGKESDTWKCLKNTCKVIKLFGIKDTEELHAILKKRDVSGKDKISLKIEREKLPEWDEEPILSNLKLND